MSRRQDDMGRRRSALYAAGRAERPSAAARNATLLALAAAEAEAKAAPRGANVAIADSARAASTASPIGWVLVGSVLVAALAFGITVGTRAERLAAPDVAPPAMMKTPATSVAVSPSPAVVDEPTLAPSSSTTVTVDALPDAKLPLTASSRVEVAPVQKPATVAKASTSAPAPVAVHASDAAKNDVPRTDSNRALAEEVQRMQAIRSRLRAGRADEAMGLITEYRKDFPAGALADEAVVLQIESLIELGRGEEATRLARRFLAERPRSPYSSRVGSLLSSIASRAHAGGDVEKSP